MSRLFSPLTLRGTTIRNRIGMAPMCQYVSDDSLVNDWHKVHLGARAIGGVGLIILEATSVTADGRVTPQDLGLWSDAAVPKLTELASFLSAQGSVPGIQLSHAGRKASRLRPWEGDLPLLAEHGGWEPVGPSPIPFAKGYAVPRELDLSEIPEIQEAFALSAKRAYEAGFKLLELHAGHGRLFHNFYSPLSNKRTDEYGGSREGRARFLLETVRAVRKYWPENYPLAVRLSCTDWVDGGFTIDDAVFLAGSLKSVGVDLIDCSSGGIVRPVSVETSPGYQVSFSEIIRRETGIATAAVGLITDSRQAEDILEHEQADMVLVGRQLLRNPHWAFDALNELSQDVRPLCPLPYLKGFSYNERKHGHLAEL